ncbi:MAG: hypothetical protein HRT35_13530, partial [Algicola sp.]|nr:hypothetical protein [Algicola sp.]
MTDSENPNSGESPEKSSEASASGVNQKTGLIIGGALVVIIGGFAAWSLLKGEPP